MSERTTIVPDEDIIAEINVTPLVDISLVLVIIFMIVAPFLSQILKPLQLPKSSKAAITEANSIKISVFPDGTLAVGSSMIGLGELPGRLKQEIASGKNPWALVRAGMEVPHGQVMQIVKIVKEAGIQRIAFAAQPKAPEVKAP